MRTGQMEKGCFQMRTKQMEMTAFQWGQNKWQKTAFYNFNEDKANGEDRFLNRRRSFLCVVPTTHKKDRLLMRSKQIEKSAFQF